MNVFYLQGIALFLSILFSVGCSMMGPRFPHASVERSVNATLWHRTSGEMIALSHQAFNVAKMRLDEDLRTRGKGGKKRALVVDVDETALDNSPYQVEAIMTGKGYPVGWKKWVEKAQAKPLPGAVDFFRYAASKGVDIFYITNRKDQGARREATIKNLERAGLPVNPEYVILRKKDRSKIERRGRVAKTHRIVLLFGDNLSDFHGDFDDLSLEDRKKAVEKRRKEFGDRFIVFPNPVYGDWEKAVYEGSFNRSEEEKAKMRKKALLSTR
ncbi:MAG: 5'-nucleotidase, lipoprotein e(P4) family [Bacteriovoracales bacterium]|nr:5'-nucleotidase, lipoprotein e(P4) family [Bacteriovoracales bacterium]